MADNDEAVQTDSPVVEYDLRELRSAKIVSDGGTAAHLVFDLGNGKQAVVHASIEDVPEPPVADQGGTADESPDE